MKRKPRRKPPTMRDVKMAGLESLKLAAAAVVSVGILWGAALALRDVIVSPVRAEARQAALADSSRYVGLIQSQQITNETLAELVVLVAATDEDIRRRTLRRLQAKYEIGVVR